MAGILYLIPSGIGNEDVKQVIPPETIDAVVNLSYFIVEEVRTARRFIKAVCNEKDINSITFSVYNEHTPTSEIDKILEPLKTQSGGIISEAGVPCIADPGALIVKRAHQLGIEVVPLTGPSSILLALMASGMNGQNFAFVGYLPVKKEERVRRIKQLEKRAKEEGQSQILMEAPYRNNAMLDDLLSVCFPGTLLCIGCEISQPTQILKTKTIAEWKKQKPDLHKRPTLFIIST
jgi:16S rRNA (cytidine1402-2'-O)-methyltransferase